MTNSLRKFLKISCGISTISFLISLFYLLYGNDVQRDPDRMLFSMLLVIFTAVASIIQALILYFLHNGEEKTP